MTQPTFPEVAKKAISEILKHVDQLIKAGQIEESIREIIRAKDVDPSNPYIHAYEERLIYLKDEHEKNAAKERTRKEAEQAAQLRDEELQRKLEEERKRSSEERKRKEEESKEKEAHNALIPEQSDDLQTNNKELDGKTITVREELIKGALKKVFSTGDLNANRSTVPPQPDKSGGGAAEKHPPSEPGIVRAPRKDGRAVDILIIDDEEAMRAMIGEVLADHGYSVTSLSTTDEALILLKKWRPNLILCDVDLKTSTMGGFSFFEKVQELENLHDVPFLFLTGLTDEIIMNRGKELGVDDYLTKPVSEQTLISSVKGKLKRYERLRKGKKQEGG